ncbi:MAG: tRNA glutamyl-Q(34) synthetase GluQRS [Steroidobacteraceae bacterium]
MQPAPYRGRFAPSPTGPLHFGSLVAAVGSYLQARKARGQWLVRIEDLDPPRTVPGSADLILHTLEAFGFIWDESVLWQGTRTTAYEAALQRLIDAGLSYPCSCTRSELQALARNASQENSGDELHYPGRCRPGPLRPQADMAWRLHVPDETICFIDQLQGRQCLNLQESIGDFVIKRRDGWFAYQLAVVVDDAEQGITEVVRGTDLLLNTPRQIALQQALGLPTPVYLHLPLAVDKNGQKLAKSSAAPAIETRHATSTLWQALVFLRQQPPDALQRASLDTLWQWAVENWNPTVLSNLRQLEYSPQVG